jgi:hypothetical protein
MILAVARRILLAACALTTTLAVARPAPAQTHQEETEPAPPHYGGQRGFGLGPAIGFGTGAGGIVNLALPPIGLWLSGGYVPVFVFGNEQVGRALTFDLFNSAQANADISFMPWHSDPHLDFGILAGYHYNTVLGNGAGAGGILTMDLGRVVALVASVELQAFPDATGRLRAQGYPGDRDPSMPWLQGGASVGLLAYP